MKNVIKGLLKSTGYEISRINSDKKLQQYGKEFLDVWEACRPYTMTSIERGFAIWNSLLYVNHSGISGDYIECGVWRGGSSMIAAHAMLKSGRLRDIYMYDTYEGMSAPTAEDTSIYDSQSSDQQWAEAQRDGVTDWCYASLEDVKSNMSLTGYPEDRISFIKGKVEDTLPLSTHDSISVLRLDTDFYASTKAEMEILFPKLTTRGVILIDDYGHWQGARQAVDEYIEENGLHLLLNRIDYTGRIAVKT